MCGCAYTTTILKTSVHPPETNQSGVYISANQNIVSVDTQ